MRPEDVLSAFEWLRKVNNNLKALVASSDELNRIMERALKPVVQENEDQEGEE